MTHTRNKNNGNDEIRSDVGHYFGSSDHTHPGGGCPGTLGWRSSPQPMVEKLEEAELYFELNNTDGDLGIHGKIDGGPWTKIGIKDSKGTPDDASHR